MADVGVTQRDGFEVARQVGQLDHGQVHRRVDTKNGCVAGPLVVQCHQEFGTRPGAQRDNSPTRAPVRGERCPALERDAAPADRPSNTPSQSATLPVACVPPYERLAARVAPGAAQLVGNQRDFFANDHVLQGSVDATCLERLPVVQGVRTWQSSSSCRCSRHHRRGTIAG
jgi:hypothetical protein